VIDVISPRFHLAGGEAFMYLEECLLLFREARNAGYEDITATTNGFWGKSMEKANEICGRLRDAGLTSLEISWDFWHMPFIDENAVSNCLEACAVMEIETNLRVLTSKQHSIREALASLRSEAIETASRITVGPVFATGRAATELSPDEFFDSRASLDSNCHRVLNLTINSFGDVSPCCAGFDQTRNYLIGNVNQEPLDTIVQRMNNDPLIRRIVFSGIGSLIPILQKSGVDIGNDYHNICHLCWTLFSNPQYTDIISNYFEDRKRQVLIRLIEEFEITPI
jgi:MoaA/NifB/PqqE/SkfB family radical SAM enzyme